MWRCLSQGEMTPPTTKGGSTRHIQTPFHFYFPLHSFIPRVQRNSLFTMASLNTSSNGPSIKSSYQGVVNSPAPAGPAASSPTYGQWALFTVSAPLVNAFQQDNGGKESVLKVQSTGGMQFCCGRLWPVAHADLGAQRESLLI